MAGVLEQNRRRIAAALILCGGGLIVCGAILILYHQYNIFTIPGHYYEESAKARNLPLAKAIRDVLFGLLIIVGIFSIGSLAMIRWSRRFRKRLLRKPSPPTPADDVWSMHRLPNDKKNDEPQNNQKP
ncbi:MAG: hypothetical protein ACYTF1_19425 [Planctomycetota bacterium]|jgi:hypothetical protein